MSETVYVALGSNLGDRRAHLESGLAALAAEPGVWVEAVSSAYETAPVGYLDQPFFLNAVTSLQTCLSPEQLLRVLQRIEHAHRRQRLIHWGPRTLDLDLLLYGARVLRTPELELPHPRMDDRCFVLAPLCELAPALCHPCTGRLFSEQYRDLDCRGQLQPAGALRLPL